MKLIFRGIEDDFECSCSKNDEIKFESEVRPKVNSGGISSSEILFIKVLDRSDYDAIEQKDSKTLYLIRG